ncbi:MAG: isoleucine--tRNA ligase [Candidatus Omnitrophota bacterium]
MSNSADYKNTLNLPQTAFPMKGELPRREPLILKSWQQEGVYGAICKKDSSPGKKYILHDGPPYANGNIHIGHALNKTLKDIIVKYKTMQGFHAPYVPGWDCHGLPVEHQLFKELKINKSQIDQLEFRRKAYKYASRYVEIQKEEFKRLGIFGEWDNPYLTLSREYEEGIVRSFAGLVKEGYVYRGLKPVNWCYRCETALAEAEVEYEDHDSPSIFVKFKIKAGGDFGEDSNLVIWTTTPWTLVANVAVAVHPDFVYSYIKTPKGKLIIANVRLGILGRIGVDKYEVIREIKGNKLEGLVYEHPFGLREGRVVSADYVSAQEGSGLVHTAPGHGAEDYLTGIKYKLPILMPVDSGGNFDGSAGEFRGLNVYDANKNIIDKLQSSGALLLAERLRHSYPHCWRCKKPIIFRATNQWFLAIDHKKGGAGLPLRRKLLDAINNDVEWIPAAGRERIWAMVESRPDWCLSRQRYWGVPIPSLICNECKKETLEPEVIERFAALVAQEGSDCWFSREVTDFIPEGFRCSCGGSSFSKGRDIMDVWFDSGVSAEAVLKKRKELSYPADLYLEGSDQHRGWFQSSLIPAICINGRPPFRCVLTHGHVVDGEGRKMSKSLGNVISPQDIIKDYGADIVRLWVAASDYNEDIRISKEMLARLSESYRKIRNTARFILSNLYDFNPDKDKVSYDKMRFIDKWILSVKESVLIDIESAYDSFEFYKAYKSIYNFCNEQLSMYYLDMAKGRLYTFRADSVERRAAQTAMYEILNTFVRTMAPILVFTAEEIWQHLPKENSDKNVASVHMLGWPKSNEEFKNFEGSSNMLLFSKTIALVPEVAKLLEELRGKGQIGSSFDARINILTNDPKRYTFLSSLKSDLCEIFKVSQVEVTKEDKAGGGDIRIEVAKAEGSKCLRCWNYSPSVGKDQRHPLICERCISAIGGN